MIKVGWLIKHVYAHTLCSRRNILQLLTIVLLRKMFLWMCGMMTYIAQISIFSNIYINVTIYKKEFYAYISRSSKYPPMISTSLNKEKKFKNDRYNDLCCSNKHIISIYINESLYKKKCLWSHFALVKISHNY